MNRENWEGFLLISLPGLGRLSFSFRVIKVAFRSPQSIIFLRQMTQHA